MSNRIATIQEAISYAQKRWPGLTFWQKLPNEASSACPWCGGDDRFSIFSEGNYACMPRKPGNCGRKGWILENEHKELTQQERRMLALESNQRRLEQEIEDQKARLNALERLVKEQAHIKYHRQTNDYSRDYWHSQGIDDNSIEKWMLGYCQSTPLYRGLPSFTIPIVNNDKLRDIRHRLDHRGKPRYLPHAKHLPRTLFNADRIIKQTSNSILMLEGEKKVIVLEQYGFPSVGVIGTNGFKDEWAKWFDRFNLVYVCYDSDAIEKGAQVASLFGLKGRVVELPSDVGKPDDYFVNGGTVNGFLDYIRKARMP